MLYYIFVDQKIENCKSKKLKCLLYVVFPFTIKSFSMCLNDRSNNYVRECAILVSEH